MPDADPLALASAQPNLSELVHLFESCCPFQGEWNRLTDAEATRYMVWSGQSKDGRKWDENQPQGKEAEPYDGASDCQVPTADDVVNWLVSVLTTAFWRSVHRLEGVELSDAPKAALARKVLDWLKTSRLLVELQREQELRVQHGATFGVSLASVMWRREVSTRLYPVRLAELAQVPGGEQIAALILDPALEDQAIALAQQVHQGWIEQKLPPDLAAQMRPLSVSRARKVIRELRTTGTTTLPAPCLSKNQPEVRALKLFEDVLVPLETTDIQSARAIFIRDWLTEAEVRQRALTEGWDKDWTEAVIKLKGHRATWTMRESANNDWDLQYQTSTTAEDLIEITWAFVKQVDEDGVMGVYQTVFHPEVCKGKDGETLYGKHELLDYWHGKYPFVEWRLETNDRPMFSARGVPQIVRTWQGSAKRLEDAVVNRTDYGVLPTIIVPPNKNWKFGPAYQIQAMAGQKPEFMDVPGGPGALE